MKQLFSEVIYMYKVLIDGRAYLCEEGTLLSDILKDSAAEVFHPCGGRGICKKCTVTVNGERVLSCRYRVHSDITVEAGKRKDILSEDGLEIHQSGGSDTCLVLDIGTTTLSMALVEKETGNALKVLTQPNAQGIYGADVMSRTKVSRDCGARLLHGVLISQIRRMMKALDIKGCDELFAAGNTVMLHTLFGEDCAALGVSPFTPVFLGPRRCEGRQLKLDNIKTVYSLPCIAPFAGADITAGLNAVEFPERDDSFYMLADLGTNAEIVLFSLEQMLVTSAAAGPCFEGVGIDCGMSASPGAIYEYKSPSDFATVENAQADGICATGLIDVIAAMLRDGTIDETGFMEDTRFDITERVYITRGDVRSFQTAKSAVYSGIMTLIKKAGITPDKVDRLYISGGFAAKMNVENAVRAGIIPKSIEKRCVPLKNTCLAGTIKYACKRNDIDALIANARYIDLSCDSDFVQSFIDNMSFETE